MHALPHKRRSCAVLFPRLHSNFIFTRLWSWIILLLVLSLRNIGFVLCSSLCSLLFRLFSVCNIQWCSCYACFASQMPGLFSRLLVIFSYLLSYNVVCSYQWCDLLVDFQFVYSLSCNLCYDLGVMLLWTCCYSFFICCSSLLLHVLPRALIVSLVPRGAMKVFPDSFALFDFTRWRLFWEHAANFGVFRVRFSSRWNAYPR